MLKKKLEKYSGNFRQILSKIYGKFNVILDKLWIKNVKTFVNILEIKKTPKTSSKILKKFGENLIQF